MNVAIEQAGIATQLVAVAAPTSRQWHRLRRDIRERVRYQDSLYCVNADALEGAVAVTEGPTGATRASKRGRRIGLWFWEVEAFPDRWDATYDLLDEIWCASEFTADVIGRVAPIPVHVVPLPVWAPSAPTPFSRQQLGLPEGFVFLFSFDFNSIFERKNPLGLIEAYTRAIGPHDGATLVIKSTNGAQHLAQRQRLGDAAAGRADIVLLEDYLDAHRMQGLIEHCDCFVSLHRSEGFGLQMATAMALRRPVIATGYSGNMTYMDAESALLVPYELVPIGPGNDPYPGSASWAAPDLDVAAERMRAVLDDPAMASAIAERGRAAVLDRQGLGRASLAVGDRLAPDIAGVAAASVA
jgi:glycosyltransferase involved in cell wall biosynthesis